MSAPRSLGAIGVVHGQVLGILGQGVEFEIRRDPVHAPGLGPGFEETDQERTPFLKRPSFGF